MKFRRTAIILVLLLLLLSLITSVVLALKRAPPYANAKTVAYPLPDRPPYA